MNHVRVCVCVCAFILITTELDECYQVFFLIRSNSRNRDAFRYQTPHARTPLRWHSMPSRPRRQMYMTQPETTSREGRANRLFQLLLGSELVGVTALLLAAVGGPRGETSAV